MLSADQRIRMSDRSDEATESRDTDDLLTETEDLLSESGVGGESGAPAPSEDRPDPGRDVDAVDDPTGGDSLFSTDGPEATADVEGTASSADADTGSGSGFGLGIRARLSGLTSRLTPDDLFSPRAFLALLLVVGAGLIGGGIAIPVAGRMVGMFGTAFAVGVLTSKRRYLEMAAAGTSVGAVSAVFSNAFLAMAGSFQRVVAVGVTVGLVACLIGYYFGRDLRNGLTQDVE